MPNIRRILREEYTEKQMKLLTLASQIGFLKTADMVGGVDDLLNILGDEFLTDNNIIKIIKEIVLTTEDEYITFLDMNENPLVLRDNEVLSQIEMLYPNDVAVFSYNTHGQDMGEDYFLYEELPVSILHDIFNMVIGYYVDNN